MNLADLSKPVADAICALANRGLTVHTTQHGDLVCHLVGMNAGMSNAELIRFAAGVELGIRRGADKRTEALAIAAKGIAQDIARGGDQAPCHIGICDRTQCRRCQRADFFHAALDRYNEEKSRKSGGAS